MIKPVSCYVVWAHQGGCCMPSLSSSDPDQSALALVWAHLSSDLQTRVIGLLAQLALNLVMARQKNPSEGEEVRCVEQTTDLQNPA